MKLNVKNVDKMIKWKWIGECVCNEPCDQMKDEEFDDEMRQMVIHSNDHNIKENNISKQTIGTE